MQKYKQGTLSKFLVLYKEQVEESSNQESDEQEEQMNQGNEEWTRVMNLQQI